MLRDKNLIPLSHQHQHALALCVRIERASPIPDPDLNAWQDEISQLYRAEITIHFAAEEKIVFPLARRFQGLPALVGELFAEHATLRGAFGGRHAPCIGRGLHEHRARRSARAPERHEVRRRRTIGRRCFFG